MAARPKPVAAPLRISFCTIVRDRFEHLRRTLRANLHAARDYENAEFVLLDYDCPDPRTREWVRSELADEIERGRLVYGFHPDTDQLSLTHSRNLAFRLSSGGVFCNVDADQFIGRRFADYLNRVLGSARCCVRGPVDGRGFAGRIAVRREDFERVGGYDEAFTSYGYEDRDLIGRLAMAGVPERMIRQERFLRGLRHDHASRMKHFDISDFHVAMELGRRRYEENRSSATVSPNGRRFGLGRVERNFTDWVDFTE